MFANSKLYQAILTIFHGYLAISESIAGSIDNKAFRHRVDEERTPDDHGNELFQWTPIERRSFPRTAVGRYLSVTTMGLAEKFPESLWKSI